MTRTRILHARTVTGHLSLYRDPDGTLWLESHNGDGETAHEHEITAEQANDLRFLLAEACPSLVSQLAPVRFTVSDKRQRLFGPVVETVEILPQRAVRWGPSS